MNKPKLSIVKKNVVDLIPYVNNAKIHSDEQISQLAASIKEFGFNNPILIDSESGVIAGHGRIMAAKKLGMSQVPCLELSHLTDIQKKAYTLADNRLAEKAGWDDSLLNLELAALQDADFDLEAVGLGDLQPEGLDLVDVVDDSSEGDDGDAGEVSDDPLEENVHARCIVSFANEKDRAEFFAVIGIDDPGGALPIVWFPPQGTLLGADASVEPI